MSTLTQDAPQDNRQRVTEPNGMVVAEWSINARGERARVSIEKYNGVWLINLRKWFEADNGEMRPAKQGIALGIRHLPQLAEAITTALSMARERGLPEGHHEGSK